jgi:hypothetical protein
LINEKKKKLDANKYISKKYSWRFFFFKPRKNIFIQFKHNILWQSITCRKTHTQKDSKVKKKKEKNLRRLYLRIDRYNENKKNSYSSGFLFVKTFPLLFYIDFFSLFFLFHSSPSRLLSWYVRTHISQRRDTQRIDHPVSPSTDYYPGQKKKVFLSHAAGGKVGSFHRRRRSACYI